jgi:hypothetical protein
MSISPDAVERNIRCGAEGMDGLLSAAITASPSANGHDAKDLEAPAE